MFWHVNKFQYLKIHKYINKTNNFLWKFLDFRGKLRHVHLLYSHIFFFTWRNPEGVCDVFMEEMQCTSLAKLRQAARKNGKKTINKAARTFSTWYYAFSICVHVFCVSFALCFVLLRKCSTLFSTFFSIVYLLVVEYYPESQVWSRVISWGKK